MSNRRSISAGEESTEVNISPLIDMVFILLIFFIVTTVFVEEEGLDVNKPQPSAATSLDNETVVFFVNKAGQVFYEDREVGLSGVRATVRNAMQKKDLPVIIEVAAEAPSGVMVSVMDEVKVAEPDVAISINQAAE